MHPVSLILDNIKTGFCGSWKQPWKVSHVEQSQEFSQEHGEAQTVPLWTRVR